MFKTASSGPSVVEPETANRAINLTTPGRAPWRLVLTLAAPLLVQQFLLVSVGLSDRFLAGHFQPLPRRVQAEAVGQELLALGLLGAGNSFAAALPLESAREAAARQIAYQSAQTTANYLAWLINSYCTLVSVGATALVARFVGAGDRRNAVRATNQAILLAVLLGLLATTIGLSGLDTFVTLLQLHGPAAELAVAYLWPMLLLLTFQVVELAGIACLIGAGDTRTGSAVLVSVAVLNLPLAWGFFQGVGPLPELGFIGIAVGTAVSHLLGGLAVLAVLAYGRAGLCLKPRLLVPNVDLLRRLLRISVPAGVDSLSLALCQLWFLGIVNRLGDTAASAHGIALGWEALAYMLGHAFGIAGMTLVGQNLGAGKPDQASHSGWVAFGLGVGIMCLMGVVFYALAEPMFLLFCPNPEQRPVIDVGVPVLQLIAFGTPAMACTVIIPSLLRGAGDTRVPVLFTWLGFLAVRIPLAYWLTERGWGLRGAWLAMCADLVVRGGLLVGRFAAGKWKRMRV